ncbi:uncharacterized protein LOC124175677 [Neodiprion fabricii]|uniref:uncharacterized protein LOC124175677 n=1 Tax=Neodiprion fabricii TaxID=2872261 RepID=UPI001ED8D4D0|nr:uncharacterized protein LOC124175677 [Neodiprion fabricii]
MCRSISFRLSLLTLMVFVGPTAVRVAGSPAGDKTGGFETVHTSNAALLNRLGLSPLRIPQGHHKKRLAGPEPPPKTGPQSPHHSSYGRRHGGHGDSHIYVVKLPPSLPYYAITKPHKSIGSNVEANFGGVGKNYNPVGFHSNGKPGSIYHWNLPMMKKIAEKKRIVEERVQLQQQQQQQLKKKNESQADRPKISVSKDEEKVNSTDMKMKRVRNNDKRLNYNADHRLRDKNYRLDDSILYKIRPGDEDKDQINRLVWNTLLNDQVQNSMYTSGNFLQRQKKHRKKSATSYYAPFTTKSGSTSIQKNFSGNGKPKAFYVIEKSRKPVYYHHLLP